MSNYSNSADSWKFLGSSRGHVSSELESPIRKVFREDNFPIIIFDEIEKASPTLWDILLSLTDTGEIEDNFGKLNFKNSIVIFTTNAGVETGSSINLIKETGDYSFSKKAPYKIFPPEFLSRVITVEFRPLTKEERKEIAKSKIDDISKKISIELNEREIEEILNSKEFEEIAKDVRSLERFLELEIAKRYLV